MRKVVFLDRDGTINVDYDYVHKEEDFEFEENAVEGLRELQEAGYELVIVTNQSGIGRGYYSEEDYHSVTNYMIKELEKEGIYLKENFYCPHRPEAGCECRKPGTGMVDAYLTDKELDKEDSWVIGDKTSDIQLAHNLGVKSIMMKTGHAGSDDRYDVDPDYVADDLLDAASFIKKR